MRISDSSIPVTITPNSILPTHTEDGDRFRGVKQKKSAVFTIGVFSAFLYLFPFLQTERKHCFPFLLRISAEKGIRKLGCSARHSSHANTLHPHAPKSDFTFRGGKEEKGHWLRKKKEEKESGGEREGR